MITYGLDLGAGSIKGLLLEEGSKILAYCSQKSLGKPLQAAEEITNKLFTEQGVDNSNIDYTTTTGFSRYLYPERDLQLSDITANARGAILLYPNTMLVVQYFCIQIQLQSWI
ncbi:MAG: BadF/BadG/BcrA/BcrD ATPase family protein [Candidatus Hodarchaeales archaeon]|jgi:activator of 2-hydroxyglutaryl-CoA dehydratase